MSSRAYIVAGLGFGDEGKGLTTDLLCSRSSDPIVIRFNGGQQAGHTVVTKEGRRHVFSNFGAGTFRGAPTYWSRYCTFSPSSLLKEYEALRIECVQPLLLVDQLCPVTTHYDVLYNRILEKGRGSHRHGSCGMGFGATIERSETPVRFYAQELSFPDNCRHKLLQIRKYYQQKIMSIPGIDFHQWDHELEDEKFLSNCRTLQGLVDKQQLKFVTEKEVFVPGAYGDTFIFEGAQGILLDMDFGFFPHVTRSHTTSKNAIHLLDKHLKGKVNTEMYYVTRAYHTRHGEGPLNASSNSLRLVNNAAETNVYNEHQGDFRVGPLNIDLIQYALRCDRNFSFGLPANLIVTCTDHLLNEEAVCIQHKREHRIQFENIPDLIGADFRKCIFSGSPCSEDIGKIHQ